MIGTVTASDVPFIFDENLADVFGYTPDQIEQAYASSCDLYGVPLISAPSDDESLEIPVTGGSGGPENEIERNVGDLKRMLNSRIEPDNPAVRREAILLAGKHPGDYTVEQVSAIYSYMKGGDGLNKGWSYVRDPRGIDYFSNASEAMSAGKEIGCAGIGDCDDFAILMSALIESIGGTTRIILARNEKTGGHAYTEVYLGRMNSEDSRVEEIIKWLQQEYSTDKIYSHIDTDTQEIWLNLDWGDEKGNAHPGGPFFQGDKHIVLCLRDGYGKTPLTLPDSYLMPASEYPQNEIAVNATIYDNTTNVTINATCNETIDVPAPFLQYIWSITGIESGPITMMLNQNGNDLSGFAKYEAEGETAWNAGVYGSVNGDGQGLQLVIESNTTNIEAPFPITLRGSFANDGFNGDFIKQADGQAWAEGSFWAVWITPDVASYTPADTSSRFTDVRQYVDSVGPGGDLSGVPSGMGITENVMEYATENTTSINETVNVTMNATAALIDLSGQVFEECLMCNMSIGMGLANWALYLHQGHAQGDIIASAITSEYGFYSFQEIPDGNYVIEVILPDGWTVDSPCRPVIFHDSGYSASPSEINFAARRTYREL